MSQPEDFIRTLDDMAQKFLSKFFPPAKTARLRFEITNFYQQDGQTLYDAWERYKDLLRKCPHHGIPLWMQVQTFYNGLIPSTRTLIDAASGGAFMSKTQEEAYNLLEEMAINNFQWPTERGMARKPVAVHEVDDYTSLKAQGDSLTQ